MVRIRRMETLDCEAAVALEKEVFSLPWSKQGFLDALDGEKNIFLVAESEDGLCGYIGMYVSLDEGEITNVAVSLEHRCAGIGGRLLQRSLELAKEAGVTQVVLEVRVSNQAAISVYEKNGFEHCGVRKGFYDFPKEDAYIMMRQLV